MVLIHGPFALLSIGNPKPIPASNPGVCANGPPATTTPVRKDKLSMAILSLGIDVYIPRRNLGIEQQYLLQMKCVHCLIQFLCLPEQQYRHQDVPKRHRPSPYLLTSQELEPLKSERNADTSGVNRLNNAVSNFWRNDQTNSSKFFAVDSTKKE